MPFFTTEETKEYFEKYGIELSEQKIRDLIKQKDFTGQKRMLQYVYSQNSVEKYAKKHGKEPEDSNSDANNSEAGKAEKTSKREEIVALRHRTVVIGGVVGIILLALSGLLFLAAQQFQAISPLKFVGYAIFSLGLALLLNTFFRRLDKTIVESKYLTVSGSAAVFFALLGLALFVDYMQPESKELDAAKKETMIYKSFTENLDGLVGTDKIHMPLNLELTVSCFDESTKTAFVYLESSKQDFKTSAKTERKAVNGATKTFYMPSRQADLMLRREDKSLTDGMIATINYDGSSYLNPTINVKLSGNSLCEDVKYESITVDSLSDNIESLVQSHGDFNKYHRELFNIIGRINNTLQDGSSLVTKGIGDKLIESLSQGSAVKSEAALNILASVDFWNSTSPVASLMTLSKLAEELKAKEGNKADDALRKIREVRANLQPGIALCRNDFTDGKEDWRAILDCLNKLGDEEDIATVKMLKHLAHLNLQLIDGSSNLPDFSTIATNLHHVAHEMIGEEKPYVVGEQPVDSYSSDALILSALAFSFAGNVDGARDALAKVRNANDDSVDPSLIRTILGDFSVERIQSEILLTTIETTNPLNALKGNSQGEKIDQFREVATSKVKRSLVAYQIFARGKYTKEAADQLKEDLFKALAHSGHPIIQSLPFLLDDETIYVVEVDAIRSEFVLGVATSKLSNSFNASEACDVATILSDIIDNRIGFDVIGAKTAITCDS